MKLGKRLTHLVFGSISDSVRYVVIDSVYTSTCEDVCKPVYGVIRDEVWFVVSDSVNVKI